MNLLKLSTIFLSLQLISSNVYGAEEKIGQNEQAEREVYNGIRPSKPSSRPLGIIATDESSYSMAAMTAIEFFFSKQGKPLRLSPMWSTYSLASISPIAKLQLREDHDKDDRLLLNKYGPAIPEYMHRETYKDIPLPGGPEISLPENTKAIPPHFAEVPREFEKLALSINNLNLFDPEQFLMEDIEDIDSYVQGMKVKVNDNKPLILSVSVQLVDYLLNAKEINMQACAQIIAETTLERSAYSIVLTGFEDGLFQGKVANEHENGAFYGIAFRAESYGPSAYIAIPYTLIKVIAIVNTKRLTLDGQFRSDLVKLNIDQLSAYLEELIIDENEVSKFFEQYQQFLTDHDFKAYIAPYWKSKEYFIQILKLYHRLKIELFDKSEEERSRSLKEFFSSLAAETYYASLVGDFNHAKFLRGEPSLLQYYDNGEGVYPYQMCSLANCEFMDHFQPLQTKSWKPFLDVLDQALIKIDSTEGQ